MEVPLGPANLFKVKSKATETIQTSSCGVFRQNPYNYNAKEEKINDVDHTPHYGT